MWLPTRFKCVPAVFLLCGLCAAANTASAVNIEGRSSTELLWYNDIVDGSKQVDASQYLRFSMSNIDSDDKLSVKGYGKLDYDLKNKGEVDNRLYYLYADYKSFLNTADIRLGRQYVSLSAGSALIDGIEADINKIGPISVVVVGGRDVVFGEEKELASHLYSYGAAAYLTGVYMTYLDVSYYRAYDYSDIARDILGADFKQYLFDSIKVYANARYDLTSYSFNEVLGGIKYFPTLNLMLTGEHYESYPTFDTTSIFSVFAVDHYKDNLVRAEYTATSWLDISLGYSHEDFSEGAHAKLYEAGLRVRPSVNMTVGLFHDKRWGYPGDLAGYKVYAEYSAVGKWKTAAGIDYDAFERDDMTGQETVRKYWAAGKYQFTKKMAGSLRVEDNVNVNYTRDMQGRLTFDVDF